MKESEKSPFFHAWEDQYEAERFRLHAREIYDHYRTYQLSSRAGHVDYGKWLIASLLAVHGGAIYAISTLKNSVARDQIDGLINGASWNLAGIFMILLAGFFAWVNFQAAEAIYDRWANPAMLYRDDQFPKDESRTDPVGASLFLAAAFGLMSGFAFLASAVTVIHTLKP
ncbi:hypothetical protein ELH24_09250 [Rhizobium ruizarguesonis]|uniref:hypothetical protein n=1 Tax=Rhizobium ruizarguesonis TaxID=2081791 RepID=UPI0010316DB2|nr:hypothetical protein [Rhizobium ruizarguesonis]TBD15703.1 hypothetical protein ELH24_09250 [Rhizobium ruizarguesonis]